MVRKISITIAALVTAAGCAPEPEPAPIPDYYSTYTVTPQAPVVDMSVVPKRDPTEPPSMPGMPDPDIPPIWVIAAGLTPGEPWPVAKPGEPAGLSRPPTGEVRALDEMCLGYTDSQTKELFDAIQKMPRATAEKVYHAITVCGGSNPDVDKMFNADRERERQEEHDKLLEDRILNDIAPFLH